MNIFFRDESRKSAILDDLSKQFSTIEEVDFELMLTIVQSCQDLQTQRIALNPTSQLQKDQQPGYHRITLSD